MVMGFMSMATLLFLPLQERFREVEHDNGLSFDAWGIVWFNVGQILILLLSMAIPGDTLSWPSNFQSVKLLHATTRALH
jgi:hypothetical protein